MRKTCSRMDNLKLVQQRAVKKIDREMSKKATLRVGYYLIAGQFRMRLRTFHILHAKYICVLKVQKARLHLVLNESNSKFCRIFNLKYFVLIDLMMLYSLQK